MTSSHTPLHLTIPSPTLAEYLQNHVGAVKLNLGCGGKRWQDFINVDLYPAAADEEDSSRSGCKADCFADVRQLPIGAGVADEIFATHVVEHFTRWAAIDLMREWHRVLKPGGKVIVEMPDFVRCVLWLMHPLKRKREMGKNQFYGNQWNKIEYETHRYLWSAREFAKVLREIGFTKVTYHHRPWTHQRGRDMHVEAVK